MRHPHLRCNLNNALEHIHSLVQLCLSFISLCELEYRWSPLHRRPQAEVLLYSETKKTKALSFLRQTTSPITWRLKSSFTVDQALPRINVHVGSITVTAPVPGLSTLFNHSGSVSGKLKNLTSLDVSDRWLVHHLSMFGIFGGLAHMAATCLPTPSCVKI